MPEVCEMTTEHPAIINGHNPRLARQLARMVGMFGARGWPEIAVSMPDGTVEHHPLPKEAAEKVQYVRKLIKEYGLEPITT
jgi:hypothetical protein